MTDDKLYRIASSKSIHTDEECENELTNKAVFSICEEEYDRFIKLTQDDGLGEEVLLIAEPRINDTEEAWISLDEFRQELEEEIRKMYR